MPEMPSEPSERGWTGGKPNASGAPSSNCRPLHHKTPTHPNRSFACAMMHEKLQNSPMQGGIFNRRMPACASLCACPMGTDLAGNR